MRLSESTLMAVLMVMMVLVRVVMVWEMMVMVMCDGDDVCHHPICPLTAAAA